MCLYTKTNIPYIAKRDIPCYKVLKMIGPNTFVTPFQKYPVNLNEPLVAEFNGQIEKCFDSYVINGGYIHACIDYSNYLSDDVIFKAIIPKGTEYFVSSDCTTICAKKLILTEKIGLQGNVSFTYEWMMDILEDLWKDNDGKHCIGDFLLSDGSIVRPSNKYDREDIVGLVCDVDEDDKVTVCGVERNCCSWKNGLKWCESFEKNGLKWHMPNKDELLKYSKNLAILTIVLKSCCYLLSSQLDGSGYYWSSSEYSSGSACGVYTNYGGVYHSYKANGYYVRPFALLA